tara:strand:- start:3822 stop:4217 length:396 start_codon:yes stop_codon:yes gene_type:complete
MFNSFLGFLFKALPAKEVHAHGGAGSTRNKRRRARSGASGGGTTPKTDAKKQELVRKHSRLAFQDGPAYKQQTSATSRRIVSNFQLQKQTTQKDYSAAIKKSIRRMTDKQMKSYLKTGKRPNFGPSKINYL